MKTYTILVILMVVFTHQITYAQQIENRFSYLIEAGVFPRLGDVEVNGQSFDSNAVGTTFRFTANYAMSPHFHLGIGVGTDNFRRPEINTLPIFVDFRGYLEPQANSFLAFYKLGYAFKISDKFDQGLINNVGIGYRIPIGRNSIIPTVGYHRLNFKTNIHEISEELTGVINSLSISIGFQF